MFEIIYKGEVVATVETKEQADIIVEQYDGFAEVFQVALKQPLKALVKVN